MHLVDRGPLTPDDCKEWANMAYWKFSEAIFLSMGLHPKECSKGDITQGEAEKIGAEFERRSVKISRNQYEPEEKNRLPIISLPPKWGEEELLEVVYSPVAFTKWAMEYFSSFPEDLYKAVQERHRSEFVRCGLSTEKTAEARVPGAEPISLLDRRWTPKREMETKAIHFAVEALGRGCNCSHVDLAEYLHTETFDDGGNSIFYHRRIKDQSMRNLLINAVREVFKEKASTRIVGTPVYRKSDAPCPIHSK